MLDAASPFRLTHVALTSIVIVTTHDQYERTILNSELGGNQHCTKHYTVVPAFALI